MIQSFLQEQCSRSESFPVRNNRWMHHGFIILVHSPYGIVGFELSSSDTVQVVQSPVSRTHTGCDQPNTKTVQTTKCIFGYSVVVCSSKC